jgi:hypothetical protein
MRRCPGTEGEHLVGKGSVEVGVTYQVCGQERALECFHILEGHLSQLEWYIFCGNLQKNFKLLIERLKISQKSKTVCSLCHFILLPMEGSCSVVQWF